ncbi:anthranilate phosphoribosyltransferase [Streptacidiphilus sp. MAP12-33]|uniref:anthranilate phosphoribosyltransferase n=1 Tax=Streptacidiphilus sp. MAP12-33 TaxID=3156266 RepID=UPI003514B839
MNPAGAQGTPDPDERRWPRLLNGILRGQDLGTAEAAWAMDQVMRGEVGPARLAALLVGLRAKGETVAELTGFVRGMMAHAVPLHVPGPTVDIVGTGGDGADTVNVSTMAALVAAGAGARVVKHGNRASTSRSGSADVLECLGVRLTLPPARVGALVEEVGITFCFAPDFHPAMRHARGVRRELGVPTVFNALGPLTNPAAPAALAVGVADPRLVPLVAGVLAARGVRALVFRGDDGLDELSVSAGSTVVSVGGGRLCEERLDPRDLGIERAARDALLGGDVTHNAAVVRRVLAGERGPVRDAVLLAAAAALAAGEDAAGRTVTARLAAALGRAAASVDSGAAAGVLDAWIAASRRHAGEAAEAALTAA